MASPQTLQCPWIDSPSSSGEEGAGALLLPQSLMSWKSLLPQVPAPEVPPKPVPAPLPTVLTLFLVFNPKPPLTMAVPTDTPTLLLRTARSTRAKKSFRRCVGEGWDLKRGFWWGVVGWGFPGMRVPGVLCEVPVPGCQWIHVSA